ncbi:DUF6062 family protein [Acetanaerobacterium elongatum]|uniref:Uncharacterized protein n=1 Tax=Acetanaerobacterium elongatum TaxID=258515 RepID=A0A1H0CPV0_9FIRM|nr:DUF6062 family protein [Acetanaerobacterium elongatum]SDN59932.1 hypothetical protein SAMN05192585_12427 [Acetanaerobacterium elongatum]
MAITMKETLYTIPISEVFEPKDGCPLCRLHDLLEERALDAIMGAAMMEPDIRIQTNSQGFCSGHYGRMLKRKNRLSLALMLESHLDELIKALPDEKALKGGKADIRTAKSMAQGCYVCAKVDASMEQMTANLFTIWGREQAFRTLYAEQPFLCLPHYLQLVERAQKRLGKKELAEFLTVSTALTKSYLEKTKADVSSFCKMFDYRSAGVDIDRTEAKTSVERAIGYLTSVRPE